MMSNERLTLEEMTEKYPDQWLFIVDCEHSENTELLSGIVFANSETRDAIYEVSGQYNGSQEGKYE